MKIMREIRKRLLPPLLAVCCVGTCLTAAAPKAHAWSSVEEFQAYALENWSRSLRQDPNAVMGLSRFGTSRNERTHAAIDISVSSGAGTLVYAMADGVVMEYCPDFYYGTSSIGIRNADGSVLRYCELSTPLRNGDAVVQGQVIGTLVTNNYDGGCMLHLELYLGTREGGLTDTGNYSHYDYVSDGGYLRRSDLLDPTFLLGITRFTGEHEHVWGEHGLCFYCGRHWTEFEDPARHAAGFLDVAVGDYCYDAVLWALTSGVSDGVGPAYFGTSQFCTRGEAMTMLWRAAGSPESGVENPFIDIAASDPCYDAVRWAYAAGITSGAGDGLFEPEGPVTRAQALLFMWRAAGSPAQAGTMSFADIEEWVSYRDAVEWAIFGGVTGGTGPATFDPAEMCTRGQLITFLYRAYALGMENYNG